MSLVRLLLPILLIAVFGGCQARSYVKGRAAIESLSESELLTIGQKVYRDGRLADGTPVKSLVLGGVPIDGTQATCLNCHRRSGMGGAEGDRFVLPINGPALFSPRQKIYHERPAYTEASLAMALRKGADSEGQIFDPVMPVYDLPALEMAGLIAYLKQLSSKDSAGVTGESIHLATVIGPGVDPKISTAMLEVLERFFKDKNSGTRSEIRRKASGSFFHEYKNKAYRTWELHRWELSGPATTWQAQLEEYYRQQPVFALISGVIDGEWQPIHRFCEEQQIPQLLPNTDMPQVDSNENFYTLYFSKGLVLEAEVLLEHLAASSSGGRIVQLYGDGSDGAFAARALRHALTAYPQFQLEDRLLTPDSDNSLQDGAEKRVATIAWLDREEIEFLSLPMTTDTGLIYLSSSLLGGDVSEFYGKLAGQVFLIHPFNQPEDRDVRFKRLETWLELRKIPFTQPRVQGQTFYAAMILGEGLMHIKSYFYRDYLLDVLDHGDRMALYANNYPRLSFGPGQRYLAKGASVVDLSRDKDASLVEPVVWITP